MARRCRAKFVRKLSRALACRISRAVLSLCQSLSRARRDGPIPLLNLLTNTEITANTVKTSVDHKPF